MGKIIVVANQKGGVGKTTTALNLASSLAELGQKVLAIDCDSQGNLTSGFGIDKNEVEYSIYDVFLKECFVEQAIIKHEDIENLAVLPANQDLSGAEIELVTVANRESILKNITVNLKYLYDFVIIDCPPSFNLLTLNAFTAADSVIIPVQCEYYALEGLSQLLKTIDLVKNSLNQFLKIEGILFTMFDGRNNLNIEVMEEVRNNFDGKIFNAVISRTIKLAESPSFGKPINLYDPNSRGTIAYRELAVEVIKNN